VTHTESTERHATSGTNSTISWAAPAKAAYQQRLNHHPHRVAGNLVGVRKDGRVLIAEFKNGQWDRCSFRCVVMEKSPGGKVSILLDAGFQYDPQDVNYQLINETDRFNAYPVTTMTYWDPSQHRIKTVRSENEEAVKLPEVLKTRKVSDLRVGQAGYVSMFEIMERRQGYGIFKWANLRYEEPKALYDGNVEPTVQVTRVSPEHFTLCLPPEGAAVNEEADVFDNDLFAASPALSCTRQLPLL